MGKYLDQLTAQFDTITAGIDDILNRAADDNREVTDEESKLVEREQTRAEELKKAIDHYAGLEVTRAAVAATRAKVPAGQTGPANAAGKPAVVVVERSAEDQLKALFSTPGAYIVAAGRALRGDKNSGERIARAQELYAASLGEDVERATQHQTTADNPGIIPRPIVGDLITLIDASRPFIASIGPTKPLPAGAFDRPQITQHVEVGVQAAEKDLTASRKMLIGKIPVAAKTYAGHVNVSRQDIKWTSPGIMQILAEDFAAQYALETEEDAESQFVASVTADPVEVADLTPASIRAALFTAAQVPILAGQGLAVPDTLWVSPDAWAALGGVTLPQSGLPAYPGISPGSPGAGDVAGFRIVLGPWFPAGTAILGPRRLLEWYEDVDGLISVQEPDVLGQLVGYAGFGAFVNVEPGVFTPLVLPAPAPPAARSTSAKAGASK